MKNNVILQEDTNHHWLLALKPQMIISDDIFEDDSVLEFDPYTIDISAKDEPEEEEYTVAPDELFINTVPTLKEKAELIKTSHQLKDKRHWKEIVNERRKQERTVTLTERSLERAQPQEKEYTIYHKKIKGFGLRVRPTGHKSFILICRKPNRKTGRLVIGDPAIMSLDAATDKVIEILSLYKEGLDPFMEEQKNRKNKELTIGALFKQHIKDTGENIKPHWKKQKEQLYHDYFEKDFAELPILQLKRGEWVLKIKSGRTPAIKRHLKCVASSFYSWCVDMEYVEMNIIAGLKLGKVKPRNHPLKDEELAAIWHSSFKLNAPFGAFVRFLMLSGQRRGEVSNLPWSEIDFRKKIWILPSDRTKNEGSHIVPLTDTMIALLDEIPRTSKFVFESTINKGHAINSFSKLSHQWKKITWVKDWRLHDLRHTFSTNMAKLRVPLEVAEALLNHRSGALSGIAGVYNHHKYEDEKREALEKWHKHLAEIVEKHKDYTPPPEPDEGVNL